jgi:hypothetical protein
MRELFLPFLPDPPVGLPSGYKCEVRGPVCPSHRPFAFCPLSPCAPFSRPSPPPSPLPRPPLHAFFDDHGGKEPDPSRGCVGSFLGDGEEAGGVGMRRPSVTESKPEPTGMEGAAVRPSGAGAPGRICGELRRFPREGARDAAELLHAGAPPLLQGGAASPCPQLHLAGCHLRRSTRGTWGWSHTGTCGSTSSRQSISPIRRASEECSTRCMQGAAPSKSEWAEASSTSRRSSSRRTANGTTGSPMFGVGN